jgi:hypothetical protein
MLPALQPHWRMQVMTTRLSALSFLVSLSCASLGATAKAADLTGVWVTDPTACSKVFVKSGNRVSFAKDSELIGDGFIIEGKEIRGPAGSCRIKTTKEEGAVTHMIAACASDIMLSDIQFSARVIDANKIVRMFPSMEGMETTYHRCSM